MRKNHPLIKDCEISESQVNHLSIPVPLEDAGFSWN